MHNAPTQGQTQRAIQVKDFSTPLLAFTLMASNSLPDAPAGWLSLAKDFGLWVIWLGIAIHFFLRSERKDEARLEVQQKQLTELVLLNKNCTEAIKESTEANLKSEKALRTLAKRMKNKACFGSSLEDDEEDV